MCVFVSATAALMGLFMWKNRFQVKNLKKRTNGHIPSPDFSMNQNLCVRFWVDDSTHHHHSDLKMEPLHSKKNRNVLILDSLRYTVGQKIQKNPGQKKS